MKNPARRTVSCRSEMPIGGTVTSPPGWEKPRWSRPPPAPPRLRPAPLARSGTTASGPAGGARHRPPVTPEGQFLTCFFFFFLVLGLVWRERRGGFLPVAPPPPQRCPFSPSPAPARRCAGGGCGRGQGAVGGDLGGVRSMWAWL